MTTLPVIVGATPLNVDDTSRLLFTTDLGPEVLTRTIGDTPADFVSMDTVSWELQWRTNVVTSDDAIGLDIRVMNGATVLAASDSVGGWVTAKTLSNTHSATDTTVGPTVFSYVNTAATKATWDGASVELRQTISKNKGPDNIRIEVDYFQLTGTYTASASWDGSFVKLANGNKARVRMPNGLATSLRLFDGSQL